MRSPSEMNTFGMYPRGTRTIFHRGMDCPVSDSQIVMKFYRFYATITIPEAWARFRSCGRPRQEIERKFASSVPVKLFFFLVISMRLFLLSVEKAEHRR